MRRTRRVSGSRLEDGGPVALTAGDGVMGAIGPAVSATSSRAGGRGGGRAKLVMIAHHLERIADRVTNIAEDLVFLEKGVIEDLG